jgi:hypothetical protein
MSSSEMLVLFYQTTRRHIPEDRNLGTHPVETQIHKYTKRLNSDKILLNEGGRRKWMYHIVSSFTETNSLSFSFSDIFFTQKADGGCQHPLFCCWATVRPVWLTVYSERSPPQSAYSTTMHSSVYKVMYLYSYTVARQHYALCMRTCI